MKQMTSLLIFCCLVITATAYAQERPALHIKSDDNRRLVMIGDDVFVGYNHQDVSKPYLYPIIGPTGANMTRHYPMKAGIEGESEDHPHHTSLWFAHGGVNGVDFWHTKSKEVNKSFTGVSHRKHRFSGVPLLTTTLYSEDAWIAPTFKVLASAKTKYAFTVLADGSRVIDYDTSIVPDKEIDRIVFADTKEGTMAIRLAPQLRLKGEVATGKAINSEGDKDARVWGKRAKWVAYWGQIDGKTCGVAIFDHPTNLRHPTWWHARDYGLVAANPFGMSDFEKGKHKRGDGNYTLKQDETLSLRYRFVFFAGTAEEADISGKYDQWVKETTSKEE
ncbi:MAG: PmoA family protein [Planctomycetota bacterium]